MHGAGHDFLFAPQLSAKHLLLEGYRAKHLKSCLHTAVFRELIARRDREPLWRQHLHFLVAETSPEMDTRWPRSWNRFTKADAIEHLRSDPGCRANRALAPSTCWDWSREVQPRY